MAGTASLVRLVAATVVLAGGSCRMDDGASERERLRAELESLRAEKSARDAEARDQRLQQSIRGAVGEAVAREVATQVTASRERQTQERAGFEAELRALALRVGELTTQFESTFARLKEERSQVAASDGVRHAEWSRRLDALLQESGQRAASSEARITQLTQAVERLAAESRPDPRAANEQSARITQLAQAVERLASESRPDPRAANEQSARITQLTQAVERLAAESRPDPRAANEQSARESAALRTLITEQGAAQRQETAALKTAVTDLAQRQAGVDLRLEATQSALQQDRATAQLERTMQQRWLQDRLEALDLKLRAVPGHEVPARGESRTGPESETESAPASESSGEPDSRPAQSRPRGKLTLPTPRPVDDAPAEPALRLRPGTPETPASRAAAAADRVLGDASRPAAGALASERGLQQGTGAPARAARGAPGAANGQASDSTGALSAPAVVAWEDPLVLVPAAVVIVSCLIALLRRRSPQRASGAVGAAPGPRTAPLPPPAPGTAPASVRAAPVSAPVPVSARANAARTASAPAPASRTVPGPAPVTPKPAHGTPKPAAGTPASIAPPRVVQLRVETSDPTVRRLQLQRALEFLRGDARVLVQPEPKAELRADGACAVRCYVPGFLPAADEAELRRELEDALVVRAS